VQTDFEGYAFTAIHVGSSHYLGFVMDSWCSFGVEPHLHSVAMGLASHARRTVAAERPSDLIYLVEKVGVHIVTLRRRGRYGDRLRT